MQKYRTFHCSSRTAGVVSHLYTDRTLSSERDTRGTHQGLSDTIAHQILRQSVVFPAFEALALALGNSLWSWVGMMPIMVEVVDESQPVIGGEDFHWATALVDARALSSCHRQRKTGMPFNIMDGQLAVYSPNGTKRAAAMSLANISR